MVEILNNRSNNASFEKNSQIHDVWYYRGYQIHNYTFFPLSNQDAPDAMHQIFDAIITNTRKKNDLVMIQSNF